MRRARITQFTTCALVAAFALFATSTAWAQDAVQDEQTAPQPTVQQYNAPPPQQQPVAQPQPPPPAQQPVQQNTNVYPPSQQPPPPQPVYPSAPPPSGAPAQQNNVVEVHAAPHWDNGYLVGEHEYRSAFLFDPGALINGVVNLEYEAALARWLGLALGVSINTYKGAFEPKTQGSFVAFGPEIGLRAHFIQPAPAGLWIGPELAVKYIAWRGHDNNGGIQANGATGTASADFAYELGAAVGYNLVINHFLLSLGVGGGFGDYGSGVQWSPRSRLGVGAAF